MLIMIGMSDIDVPIDGLVPRDLNLLVSLALLAEERSVTATAKRVGVSQSAMSHQLKRLREHFADPLFVASPSGLVPTPRLEALAGPLREALAAVGAALDEGAPFDPSTSTERFVVAGSDIHELVGMPRLLSRLALEAPHVRVAFVRRSPRVVEELTQGRVHLAVAPAVGSVPGVGLDHPQLQQRRLRVDGFRVLVRDGHPRIRKRLTLEAYLDVDHILVSPAGGEGSVVDRALAKRGERRHVRAQVSHFAPAPFLVARTDLILTCPTGLAEAGTELAPVRSFAPPIELPETPAHAYWHERFHHDPAHRWLREFVATELAQ